MTAALEARTPKPKHIMDTTAAQDTITPYDDDFAAWAQQQAAFVLAGDWSRVDAANVSEELAALALSQKRQIGKRLFRFFAHVIKLRAMPNHTAGNKWRTTIRDQRREIADLLVTSPSLVDDAFEAFPTALRRARADVREDYGLDVAFDDDAAWTYLVESLYGSLEDYKKRDATKLHRCVDGLRSLAQIKASG
jgi:hypothetical protein